MGGLAIMLTHSFPRSGYTVRKRVLWPESFRRFAASPGLAGGEWISKLDKTRAEELLDYLEANGWSGRARLDGTRFAIKANQVI